MPYIKNRLNTFTILYLPKRTLRIKGKEVKEIYQYELDSKEFKRRKDDFIVVEEKASNKVVSKDKEENTSNSQSLITFENTEPANQVNIEKEGN